MATHEGHDSASNELPETNERRDFLKKALIAASGLTFGYSLIDKAWAADTVRMAPMAVQARPVAVAKPRPPGHFTLAAAKRTEAVQRITPTLNDLLTNAGVKMDAQEMNELQKAFAERGTITIPGGDPRVASTLSISGSVTWK